MAILGIVLLLWLLPTLVFFAVVAVALPGVLISGRAQARSTEAVRPVLAPVADASVAH